MSDNELTLDPSLVEPLTRREKEILALLGEQLSNREIADQLVLSLNTVKWHVRQIYGKFGVENRRQAIEQAKALGLLGTDQSTKPRPPNNLPAEPTQFVGRSDELGEIKRQLEETRLLTLTGPGGIGKTRLALRAAMETAEAFDDGCFFVSLAPIGSVDHIIQTIAETVRCPLATHEDPQHQLLRFLRKRQLLLVIDNFEHLLDGGGILGHIILSAPAVKILATSRERLNLQSETILPVGGMTFPDEGEFEDTLSYDAITLFIQSARKVRPGFDPSPIELVQITNICQLVEGMPLAIELAAAWLHILNVADIAEELEKGLDILSVEMRDLPRRHRSIRAVFDHSWSLLDRTEQEIFMLLSAFRGGLSREAAQQVTGASLKQLAGLVDKSFLNHDPDSARLEIHELLRQYAQDQLRKTPEAYLTAQEAHATYYARFMQQWWKRFKGNQQSLALVEIKADIQNVRAAWRYFLDQRNAPQMWKFINGLWQIYWCQGWNLAGMELYEEATRVLQDAEDEDSITLRALAVAFQGFFMGFLGFTEQGYQQAKESVEILEQFNQPEALVYAYDTLFVNAYFLDRFVEDPHATNKMLKSAEEVADKWVYAFALFAVSWISLRKEDYSQARRLAETSLRLYEEIDNSIGLTWSLLALGRMTLACGEYQAARGFFLRCQKLSRVVGYHYAITNSSKYLGKVALSMGKISEAENYLLQSLRISSDIGLLRDIINLIYEFACLRVAQGDLVQATSLLAFVLQHPASHQARLGEGRIRDNAKDLLGEIEADLPPDTYATALEQGQALELDDVVTDLLGSKILETR